MNPDRDSISDRRIVAHAQAAINSVGLLVQPGAKDAVSETRVRGYLPPGRAGVNVRMTEGRQN